MFVEEEIYLKQLEQFFRDNNLGADENQFGRLAHYASLLAEKNQMVNLISRKDIESVVENHIFISAFMSKFTPERCCSSFIDIGTGGGLPAIPFAIMNPLMKGVAVDSIKKKADAVSEFINKLKLGNLKAFNSRVEDKSFIENHCDKYDLVITRATVPLYTLLNYSIPLIREKAYVAAIKGGDLSQEVKYAEQKFKPFIKKTTIFELSYKPTNIRNEKEKKLILMELNK